MMCLLILTRLFLFPPSECFLCSSFPLCDSHPHPPLFLLIQQGRLEEQNYHAKGTLEGMEYRPSPAYGSPFSPFAPANPTLGATPLAPTPAVSQQPKVATSSHVSAPSLQLPLPQELCTPTSTPIPGVAWSLAPHPGGRVALVAPRFALLSGPPSHPRDAAPAAPDVRAATAESWRRATRALVVDVAAVAAAAASGAPTQPGAPIAPGAPVAQPLPLPQPCVLADARPLPPPSAAASSAGTQPVLLPLSEGSCLAAFRPRLARADASAAASSSAASSAGGTGDCDADAADAADDGGNVGVFALGAGSAVSLWSAEGLLRPLPPPQQEPAVSAPLASAAGAAVGYGALPCAAAPPRPQVAVTRAGSVPLPLLPVPVLVLEPLAASAAAAAAVKSASAAGHAGTAAEAGWDLNAPDDCDIPACSNEAASADASEDDEEDYRPPPDSLARPHGAGWSWGGGLWRRNRRRDRRRNRRRRERRCSSSVAQTTLSLSVPSSSTAAR